MVLHASRVFRVPADSRLLLEPDGALETIGSLQLAELLDSAEEGRTHEVVSEHPVERVFRRI